MQKQEGGSQNQEAGDVELDGLSAEELFDKIGKLHDEIMAMQRAMRPGDGSGVALEAAENFAKKVRLEYKKKTGKYYMAPEGRLK